MTYFVATFRGLDRRMSYEVTAGPEYDHQGTLRAGATAIFKVDMVGSKEEAVACVIESLTIYKSGHAVYQIYPAKSLEKLQEKLSKNRKNDIASEQSSGDNKPVETNRPTTETNDVADQSKNPDAGVGP